MAITFFFLNLIIFIIGTALGSFSSVLSHRTSFLSMGQQASRSACPACGHMLGVRDLVPLLSWLFLRGRCRHCGGEISFVYPLLELCCGIFALVLYYICRPDLGLMFWGDGSVYARGNTDALLFFVFALMMLPFFAALIVVDLKQYRLPDRLLLVIFILGMCRLAAEQAELGVLMHSIFFGFVYGGLVWLVGKIMDVILHRRSIGLGDVKLFALCGFLLGGHVMSFFFILCGGMGVLLGGVWQYVTKSQIFPFGPAIIVAYWICELLPKKYVDLFYSSVPNLL